MHLRPLTLGDSFASRPVPTEGKGPLVLFLAAAVVTLAACASNGDGQLAQGLASPSAPPPAPAEIVDAVAARIAPSTIGSSAQCGSPSHDPSGRAASVNLEDPGRSGQYQFSPNEFTFGVGEIVNFTFTAETEFHTFTVDGLCVDEALNAGETALFSFTFEEAGTFRLICIPHESLGMVGTIVVQ